MQTYFNPVLDGIYAALALGPLLHFARILAGVMGLWYGAVIFLAFQISRRLYPGKPIVELLATVLAVTGAWLRRSARRSTRFRSRP